jgi:ribonuclease BN (tRNA processing enzyme)
MELTIIGTGTVAPSPFRIAPSHWVTAGSAKLLMDCGAGCLHRAAQIGVPWWTVTHVAISHFHVDHWGELAHLLFALRWGIEPARVDPLTLLGPCGFRARMTTLAATFGDWILAPGYPLTIQEIRAREPVELVSGLILEACHTPHTQESLAFGIRDEKMRLVYTADTGPSDELAAWAVGCDLLLCECSLPDDRPMEIHLTPTQAGQLAHAARAKRLVLTHFYPPVEATDPETRAGAHFTGPVTAAQDGDRFVIGS